MEKRTEILLLVTLWNQFFSVTSKKIYLERLENRSLASILKQNKELISKLDDSTRKNSSLEVISSFLLLQISVLQKRAKEVKLSSSKLNEEEE